MLLVFHDVWSLRATEPNGPLDTMPNELGRSCSEWSSSWLGASVAEPLEASGFCMVRPLAGGMPMADEMAGNSIEPIAARIWQLVKQVFLGIEIKGKARPAVQLRTLHLLLHLSPPTSKRRALLRNSPRMVSDEVRHEPVRPRCFGRPEVDYCHRRMLQGLLVRVPSMVR